MGDCRAEYVLKRGEVGSLMTFVLSDDNGEINLAEWTVTMTVKKGSSTPVVLNAACSILPLQNGADKGKGTYEWDSTTANIPVGRYNLEFKAVNPSGDVYYFPKKTKEPYAVLIVMEPLA